MGVVWQVNCNEEDLSPDFSPGREARERRCPEIQGFDESSPRPELGTKAAERRERDKARRRTVQVVEPFVRAERRRFGEMRARSSGLVRIAG